MIILGGYSFKKERMVTAGVKFSKDDESGEIYGHLIVGLSAGEGSIKDVTFSGKPGEIIEAYVKVLSRTDDTNAEEILEARDKLYSDLKELGEDRRWEG